MWLAGDVAGWLATSVVVWPWRYGCLIGWLWG